MNDMNGLLDGDLDAFAVGADTDPITDPGIMANSGQPPEEGEEPTELGIIGGMLYFMGVPPEAAVDAGSYYESGRGAEPTFDRYEGYSPQEPNQQPSSGITLTVEPSSY